MYHYHQQVERDAGLVSIVNAVVSSSRPLARGLPVGRRSCALGSGHGKLELAQLVVPMHEELRDRLDAVGVVGEQREDLVLPLCAARLRCLFVLAQRGDGRSMRWDA